MRKALMSAASAAVLLVGLAGCSSGPEIITEADPVEVETEETTAPLTAEPVEDDGPKTPEQEFLALVRPVVEKSDQIKEATDEQLLAAADDACAQLADGADPMQIQLVENEEPNALGTYEVSFAISSVASQYLC